MAKLIGMDRLDTCHIVCFKKSSQAFVSERGFNKRRYSDRLKHSADIPAWRQIQWCGWQTSPRAIAVS
jgi:hypothetical protein